MSSETSPETTQEQQRYYRKENYAFLLSTMAGKKTADAHIRNELKIRSETWRKYSAINSYTRAPRSDRLKDEVKEDITKFYDSVSSMLGGKRYNLKGGVQKRVLTTTLDRAHKKYLSRYPHHKVSRSCFAKYRPKHIATVGHQKFRSALCKTCLNISHEVEALNRAAGIIPRSTGEILPQDKEGLFIFSLCKGKQPNEQCINGLCKECGVRLVEKDLSWLAEKLPDEKFEFLRWEQKVFTRGKSRMKTVDQEPRTKTVDQEPRTKNVDKEPSGRPTSI